MLLFTRSRLAFVVVLVAVAGLLIGGPQVSLAAPAAEPVVDHLLEPDEVVTATAAEFRALLERHRGSAVIVNIWATYCVPCLKELPDLDRLQEEYRDQGLKVLAVSIDRPKKLERTVRPFFAKYAPNLVSYLAVGEKKPVSRIGSFRDAQKFVYALYPEWEGTLPATVILDSEGSRLTAFSGSRTYEQFETFLQEHVFAEP